MIKQIISTIRKELKQNIDLKYKISSSNFFNEPIKLYGVRASLVRKIANKYFKEISGLKKSAIYKLIEELMKSGYNEEFTIASSWLYKLTDKFEKSDYKTFERWLNKYVNNWAKCDDYCTHSFGFLIWKYPELLPKLKILAKSKNRWARRASAVILIHPIKKRKYLKNIFAIADILFLDDDDLVQKGYGWMLKEATNFYQKEVFNYVMKHKAKMPRTALRYAIEKMPKAMKQKAMNK